MSYSPVTVTVDLPAPTAPQVKKKSSFEKKLNVVNIAQTFVENNTSQVVDKGADHFISRSWDNGDN